MWKIGDYPKEVSESATTHSNTKGVAWVPERRSLLRSSVLLASITCASYCMNKQPWQKTVTFDLVGTPESIVARGIVIGARVLGKTNRR